MFSLQGWNQGVSRGGPAPQKKFIGSLKTLKYGWLIAKSQDLSKSNKVGIKMRFDLMESKLFQSST